MNTTDKDISPFLGIVFFLFVVFRPPIGSGNSRGWFEFAVKCLVLLSFASFLYSEVNKIAGIFLVCAVLSHAYPKNTLESCFALQSIVVGLGFYAFIILRTGDNIKYFLMFLCAVAMIHVVFLSFQSLDVDPHKFFFKGSKMDMIRPDGLMANPNEASAFLALSLPAFLILSTQSRSWLYFLPLIVYGLVCARSFNGAAALAVGLIFYASTFGFETARWSIYGAGAALAVYFIMVDGDLNLTTRYNAWQIAAEQYTGRFRKPVLLTGIGIGNWKKLYLELAYNKLPNGAIYKTGVIPTGYIRLHSTYVEATMEMGMMFTGLITAYGIQLKRMFTKKNALPFMGIVIGAVLMMSNSVFKMNAWNGMLIIFWCAYVHRDAIARQAQGKRNTMWCNSFKGGLHKP